MNINFLVLTNTAQVSSNQFFSCTLTQLLTFTGYMKNFFFFFITIVVGKFHLDDNNITI